MFKFNFHNSEETLNKTEDLKIEKSKKNVKESTEIKILKDQYEEIVENLKSCHLKVFISR